MALAGVAVQLAGSLLSKAASNKGSKGGSGFDFGGTWRDPETGGLRDKKDILRNFLDPTKLGGIFGGGDERIPDEDIFRQLPEFAESEQARGKWWEKLQEWENQPGYGAIAPDWGDIWDRAEGKVNRYYWGSPTSPGAVGKIRASAARRGVSESPALETNISRMAKEEGLQLQDMATEQAMQEALFGEQGRQNWMAQLMGLTQVKPSYISVGGQQGNDSGSMLGGIVSQVGGVMSQNSQNKWYENMLEKYGNDGVGSVAEEPTYSVWDE